MTTNSNSPRDFVPPLSPTQFRQRLSLVLTLPLVLMALIAGFQSWQLARVRARADRIHRSDDLLSQAAHTDRITADLEVALRNFLSGSVRGGAASPEPFNRAKAAAGPALETLVSLASVEAAQSQRAERVRSALNTWIDYAHRIIQQKAHIASLLIAPAPPVGPVLPSAKVKDAAPPLPAVIVEERKLMEPARASIASLIHAEENLREQERKSEASASQLALGSSVALALLFGILMAGFFSQQIKDLWTCLTSEIGRLSKAVEERDSELEATREELTRLREREQFYRAIPEGTTAHGLFRVSLEGKIMSWNPGAERLLGLGASEASGKSFSLLFPDTDADQARPGQLIEAARRTSSCAAEGWLVRPDGSRFWADLLAHSLRDENGHPAGYSLLVRDASRRRQAERERLRLLSRVEEEVHARDKFLAIAAHELQVPVVALGNQLKGLLLRPAKTGGAPSATLRPVLEGLKRQTDRLERLTGELTQLSRAQACRLAYNLGETGLSQLARETVLEFREEAAAHGCSIEIHAGAEVTGSWDLFRIRQVLGHLLSNAIRHGAGKPIVIGVSGQGERALLSVTDFGPGIRGEQQERIFERFSSRSIEDGVGLGLYLSRQIAEGHGGRLRVDSEPGEGATFILELPCHAAEGESTGLTPAGLTSRITAKPALEATDAGIPGA